jgi:hypothetical protein
MMMLLMAFFARKYAISVAGGAVNRGGLEP